MLGCRAEASHARLENDRRLNEMQGRLDHQAALEAAVNAAKGRLDNVQNLVRRFLCPCLPWTVSIAMA